MISALKTDSVVMALDEATQLLLRLIDVELRILLHRLGELVVALHRRVMSKHLQNESFLDCLFHGISVESVGPDRAVRLRVRPAENLERLVLGRGGEREVTRVGEQLA